MVMDLPKNDHFIDSDHILSVIKTLVEIESPTSSPAGVNLALDEVVRLFGDSGATIDRFHTTPDYGDIVRVRSHPESQQAGILVLSHVDTVHPIGTLHGALPYRQEGDKVFGPGIFDMKACFAIAIAAFKSIASGVGTAKLPITMLFTPDEEVGSPVSRQTIEAEAARAKYVLVTEPTREGGKVVTARKGVGRFVIKATGAPSHAGTAHQKGHSAIRAMAEIISTIEGFTDYERGITTNVGLISGGTGVNVIPEHCMIEADLRICNLADADEMIARFMALKPSNPHVKLTVEGGLNRPPYTHDEVVDRLFVAAANIAKDLGFQLEAVPQTGGGADGNFTAVMGIPTLDGLGVEGNGAHTNDEYILFSSIEPRTRFMHALMTRLA